MSSDLPTAPRRRLSKGEIDALRQRLDDAESTLNAIVGGYVDAIVVADPIAERQVMLLEDATRGTRLPIDRLRQAAVTISTTGDVLHVNLAFSSLLGVDPAKRPDADPAQLRPAVPVTLVHGEEDATVPIEVTESYAAKHPQARVVRIADCGHYALIDPLSAAWPCVIDEMVRFD